jgi:hypothetical protein
MKYSNNNRGNCIVTVLDANDLPPLNSNTSSTVNQLNSPSPTNINRNRRHQNNHRRNFLHRFSVFNRSNQSQT